MAKKKNTVDHVEDVKETEVVDKKEGAAEEVSGVKPETEPVAEKPKRKRKEKVVIDEEARDTRILLKGAKSKCTILKGMLERVDVAENSPTPESAVFGVLHYKNFKIMIPALFMNIEVPDDVTGKEKAAILRKHMNTMLGASIEYVVTKVSETANVAIGDRSIAMSIKKKQNFINKYRNTGMSYMEYAMENKVPVEADIMAVSGSQIRLNIGGADGRVLARDAAWRFSNNLSENFFPGDTVKVIIKEIHHNEETGEYSVKASIKDTTPNAQINNIADYSVSSTCLARVSGAIQSGYFLAIGDNKTGIEAFCDLVHGGITPMIDDVVSCQLTKIDYETGQAKAKITRIIRRAKD